MFAVFFMVMVTLALSCIVFQIASYWPWRYQRVLWEGCFTCRHGEKWVFSRHLFL